MVLKTSDITVGEGERVHHSMLDVSLAETCNLGSVGTKHTEQDED
jgi:hypothetical protein